MKHSFPWSAHLTKFPIYISLQKMRTEPDSIYYLRSIKAFCGICDMCIYYRYYEYASHNIIDEGFTRSYLESINRYDLVKEVDK